MDLHQNLFDLNGSMSKLNKENLMKKISVKRVQLTETMQKHGNRDISKIDWFYETPSFKHRPYHV